MESLNKFDQLVLDAAYNDYEAPHTIAADLSRILGRAVEEQEVHSAFSKLTHLGLVQAFEFDPTAQQYRLVQAAMLSGISQPWFLAVRSAPIS